MLRPPVSPVTRALLAVLRSGNRDEPDEASPTLRGSTTRSANEVKAIR